MYNYLNELREFCPNSIRDCVICNRNATKKMVNSVKVGMHRSCHATKHAIYFRLAWSLFASQKVYKMLRDIITMFTQADALYEQT